MRLLFVLPEYPPDFGGGIATFYEALLPALVRAGHAVDVLVGSAVTEGTPRYERAGVRVGGLEPGRAERLLPAFSRYAALPEVQRSLAAARALWEQAAGGAGYDAVEVVDWGLLAAPWVAEAGPPAVVQMHGSSGQIAAYDTVAGQELAGQTLQLLEAGLFAGARALHTHSRANAAFWRAHAGRAVGVSPPPVPAQEPARAPRAETGFVAARVQEWKGPHVLAAALRRLGPDAPAVEWAGRAVGHPGTGEPYDAVLARDFPDVWGRTLRPLGRVEPAAVAAKQASAAFVVVPSLWDVYNLTVAEAMMQRAVVICSDGAGGVDLVDDGRNAFAVPAGDAAALADAIRRALALGPAAREAMREAARETALRETDPDRAAEDAARRYAALGAAAAPALAPWLAAAVQPGPPARLDDLYRQHPLPGLLRHAAGRLRGKLPFGRA